MSLRLIAHLVSVHLKQLILAFEPFDIIRESLIHVEQFLLACNLLPRKSTL